jgi:hypothetical protein
LKRLFIDFSRAGELCARRGEFRPDAAAFPSGFRADEILWVSAARSDSGQDRDIAGYNFWLDKLEGFKGNFQEEEMFRAFLISN